MKNVCLIVMRVVCAGVIVQCITFPFALTLPFQPSCGADVRILRVRKHTEVRWLAFHCAELMRKLGLDARFLDS